MMEKRVLPILILLLLLITLLSCSRIIKSVEYKSNFNETQDRVWIGRDFWAIPLEDWQIKNGRLECVGNRDNMRINLLTTVLGKEQGDFYISFRAGILEKSETTGSAGVRIGVFDAEDPDVRAACYFGRGIDMGISTEGHLFIENRKHPLPENFDLNDIFFQITGKIHGKTYELELKATDINKKTTSFVTSKDQEIHGLICLVNHFPGDRVSGERPKFWFDDLQIRGSKCQSQPENKFGPILWSMYTLSRNTLKLTAQLAPVGERDNQTVQLMFQKNGKWQLEDEQKINPDARIATFKIVNWDPAVTVPYRLKYVENLKNGKTLEDLYEGHIRKDPLDKPLVMGGMTCQYGTGFPYTPLVQNLTSQNTDLLYFSGDQIYEANGGYGIIREPADKAILNYLGKWYMFGWAFGDLMRDRPTICTPDDHDVFQGNIWGEGGKKIPLQNWETRHDDIGGFVQPAQMLKVVYHTQCAHLPDPYVPTPMEQDIPVFYTHLLYGRISFAIISDRIFKSSPQRVAFWEGRADHVKEPLVHYDEIDNPNLKFLGERQLEFLKEWISDWRGADMKVVLSQTIFANIATHHGADKMVLYADLDSGGWPKSARDKAIDIMRRGFAFHIVGDQHFPSLSQYGINNFRDAGWVFCTPAIFVGYERRFQPERLGWGIKDPPAPGLPNTGYYRDGLGNLQYVYAVGNPVDNPRQRPRYIQGEDKASGFGIIRFDQKDRTITVEAYKFLSPPNDTTASSQFPGWPHTINQQDNYGRQARAFLPTLEIEGISDPVIQIINEKNQILEYILRIRGNSFTPKVFDLAHFTVKVGDPDRDLWKEFNHLPADTTVRDKIAVQF
jgi:alkaline phosphatase D